MVQIKKKSDNSCQLGTTL